MNGEIPARFVLYRDESSPREATGVVAAGVEFIDGRVAYRWLIEPRTTQTAVSAPCIEHIHCRDDSTQLLGVDELPDDVDLPELRRFLLIRHKDVNGMSGTGAVAGGVEFDDGRVAYRWRSNPCSTQFADEIGDVEEIHGHNGKTIVRYVDEPPEGYYEH